VASDLSMMPYPIPGLRAWLDLILFIGFADD
jgi:hypothetical protein